MGTLRRLFDFYIFANIHVALSTFCLVKITLLAYTIHSNLIPLFVFFSTITSYNFIRLYRLSEVQNWLYKFIKNYKKIILFLTISTLLIVIYLIFYLDYKAIITLVPFGFFTLFYVLPFPVRKDSNFSLRSIAFLKLFLIAISWAGVTVLVPLINYEISIRVNQMIIFFQRFLFVVVITLPFDIRDLKFDAKGLKTLPQVIGIQKSKVFGLLLLMLFLGLEFFKSSATTIQFRINLVVVLLCLLFLVRSTKNQHKYYSAFFVESIPILWFLIVVFLI